MEPEEVPVFPLNTVLLPGGALPLRIFETRYIDMVRRCLREDAGFVVTQIAAGSETGSARFHAVGTLAKICDFDQYEDGLLGITGIGEQRVQIVEARQLEDGLHVGRVAQLAADTEADLPEEYTYLARLLEQFIDQIGGHYDALKKDYASAGWVGSRLAELLPISGDLKQACLELTQPIERLELLAASLKDLTNNDQE